MRPEKQRHGGVKQCVAEVKQRKVTLCIAKEWQSSAQKCKGAVQRSSVKWREATVL